MAKDLSAQKLKEEIRNLHILADFLDNEDNLYLQNDSDCSKCVSEIISNLMKAIETIEQMPCVKQKTNCFFKLFRRPYLGRDVQC